MARTAEHDTFPGAVLVNPCLKVSVFLDLLPELVEGLAECGVLARVLGHATLEQALQPWPGIACKAIVVPATQHPDAAAHAWLAALETDANPRAIPPLPIFGYPGWLPGNERPGFYDDRRYFRERLDRAAPARPVPPPDAAR